MKKIQKEIKEWANKNFGEDRPNYWPLLGIGEELGELHHAFLKKEQKIRKGEELYQDAAKDALGDMLIYMMDFCAIEGFDFEDILETTWNEVKKRDWTKNPEEGKQ